MPVADAGLEEEIDEVLVPTEEVIEVTDTKDATAPAKKKRPARKRAQVTGQLTKAQVASVLDTYQDVQEASAEALTILKVVLREPDADHGELTAAILGADRADNPLATLGERADSADADDDAGPQPAHAHAVKQVHHRCHPAASPGRRSEELAGAES